MRVACLSPPLVAHTHTVHVATAVLPYAWFYAALFVITYGFDGGDYQHASYCVARAVGDATLAQYRWLLPARAATTCWRTSLAVSHSAFVRPLL